MTAASGLVHEEFHGRAFARRGGLFEMVQLWVNLPAKDKTGPPGYQGILDRDIPKANLPGDRGAVLVIAGEFAGAKGPASTFTPIQVWDLRLASDEPTELELPDGYTTALVVAPRRASRSETHMKTRKTLLAIALAFTVSQLAAHAQEPPATTSNEELAKQTQNPVAKLISVPFQNNTNFGLYDTDRTQNVLNIQPVIPFSLTDEWNVITRTIVPLVWQPSPFESQGDFGLSDITFTAFLSPAGSGSFVWGAGPILQLPTSVNDRVGPGKFGLGPSVVTVVQPGPFVIGALVNNVFSLTGDSDTPYVNLMTLQPFVNYNVGKTGWYLVSAPLINASWNAPGGDVWTVPVGGGFGKVFTLGEQPINAGVQGYYNAAWPENGPVTSLRVAVQLLFPTG